jgi:hypothetical protein
MAESNIFGDLTVMPGVPLSAGKIFFVAQSGTDAHAMLQEAIGHNAPTDKFQLVSCAAATADVAIQAALDACVANRNDYVIVMPSTSDYDLTATLTMSKARSHLICPDGIGWRGIPGNSARMHVGVAATNLITVTADCVEVAGFFFKGYDGTAHDTPAIIYLSGTRWAPHIHDNFFGMGCPAAGTNYGVLADAACSHFSIHDNYFTNYAPTLTTGTNNAASGFIGITHASSTRGVIRDNIMHTGCNTTFATAINCQAAYAVMENNIMVADQAVGAADAGVLTIGISGVASSVLVRNVFIGMASEADQISGPTADLSCALNYSPQNGGTIVDADTADS